jgi:hypothetical protein
MRASEGSFLVWREAPVRGATICSHLGPARTCATRDEHLVEMVQYRARPNASIALLVLDRK